MDIPGGGIAERETCDQHVIAIRDIQEARTNAARHGIVIFAGFDKRLVGGKEILEALALKLDHLVAKRKTAAEDRTLTAQNDIAAVRARLMVKRTHIQKRAIAFHLQALKAARNAREIILGALTALDRGALIEIDLRIAMQAKRARQIRARGEIEASVGRQIVKRLLKDRTLQSLAVTRSKIGRFGDIDALLRLLGL